MLYLYDILVDILVKADKYQLGCFNGNWNNWHSFCDFSRLQIWPQTDRVTYLKILINTIISIFSFSWMF